MTALDGDRKDRPAPDFEVEGVRFTLGLDAGAPADLQGVRWVFRWLVLGGILTE